MNTARTKRQPKGASSKLPRVRPGGRARIARSPSAVVIEDHPGLRDAVVEMLRHDGWWVREFDGVESALVHIRATLPDVVLTDIHVGALSGAALARELRLDPSTAPVALVAMTGSVNPSARMRNLFDVFLLKPIDLGQLGDTLRRAIVHRAAG